MSAEAQLPLAQRSALLRFFRWLSTWRIIRRTLIAFAWLITLSALVYGVENWRGRRAWHQYRQQLESQGAQLSFEALVPPPIPDEQNFAATPFVRSLFVNRGVKWQDDFFDAQKKIAQPKGNERGRRHLTDLVATAKAFTAVEQKESPARGLLAPGPLDRDARAQAAPAVLEALKPTEPIFAELRSVSGRPAARYPIDYRRDDPWGILLFHLGPISALGQRLQLKACAHLAAGQTHDALQDVRLILRLADSLQNEPLSVSYLTRLSCLHLAVAPIWEALVENRWSDDQLKELQTHLLSYELVRELDRPLHLERAAGILTAELLYEQKYRLSNLFDIVEQTSTGGALANLLGRVAPRGWYYREQLNYCRLYERLFGNVYDPKTNRIHPQRVAENDQDLEGIIASGRVGKMASAMWRHQLLATMMLPNLSRVVVKTANAQTAINHAALAVGLERYRLAVGEFPENLEMLVPKFINQLPRDVITVQPYHYRRSDKTHYLLYSVGWNEHDDGGTPGQDLFDQANGDWVWSLETP